MNDDIELVFTRRFHREAETRPAIVSKIRMHSRAMVMFVKREILSHDELNHDRAMLPGDSLHRKTAIFGDLTPCRLRAVCGCEFDLSCLNRSAVFQPHDSADGISRNAGISAAGEKSGWKQQADGECQSTQDSDSLWSDGQIME